MTEYTLKRKLYTKYDETDTLKRMKDSDILAEKKRPVNDYGGAVRNAALGAVSGATVGSIVGGFTKRPAGAVAGVRGLPGAMARGGAKGALLGGVAMGALSLARGSKKREENQFYNQRLAYAQRQAKRREKADWKTNMTQRDGYSY